MALSHVTNQAVTVARGWDLGAGLALRGWAGEVTGLGNSLGSCPGLSPQPGLLSPAWALSPAWPLSWALSWALSPAWAPVSSLGSCPGLCPQPRLLSSSWIPVLGSVSSAGDTSEVIMSPPHQPAQEMMFSIPPVSFPSHLPPRSGNGSHHSRWDFCSSPKQRVGD